MAQATRRKMTEAASLLVVVALLLGACGDSADPASEVAAQPTSTPEQPVTSSTDSADGTSEAWAEGVADGWDRLFEDLSTNYWDDFYLDIQADDTIEPWVVWFQSDANVLETFGALVTDAPDDTALTEASSVFGAAIAGSVEQLRSLADEIAADPQFEGSLLDNTALDDVAADHAQAMAAVTDACFPFQKAVADAGLALIDCANTGDGPVEVIEASQGPPALPVGFNGEPQPGVYEMADFARPFAMSFALPVWVNVGPSVIEILPMGDWEEPAYAFWVIAPDELALPGTAYGRVEETVPFPEDFGEWLLESGFEIVADGELALPQDAARYWTVEVAGWDIENAGGGLVLASFEGGQPGSSIQAIRHNSTIWQVPHPGGPLLVVAAQKYEIPGAPDIASVTDLVAGLVATMEPIEGAGAAVEPTPAAPTPTSTPEAPEPTETVEIDPEALALRDTVLALEGFERWTDTAQVASVHCDEPEIRSTTPVAQHDDAVVEMFTRSGRNVMVFEFRSTADRDAYFTAIVEGRAVCERYLNERLIPEILEIDPGQWILFSSIFVEEDGAQFPVVELVATVGPRSAVSIGASTRAEVEAIAQELGVG